MDFSINEEQKQILALIKQFGQKELMTKAYTDIVDAVTAANNIEEVRVYKPKVQALLDKMHDIGLRQIGVPERYGGGGADLITKTLIAEHLGYWGGREIIGGLHLMGSGNHGDIDPKLQKQEDWFFEQFMSNTHLIVGGTNSEAASGSDVHFPYEEGGTVYATKEGNEWVITGDKGFCTSGPMADLLQVLVRTSKTGPFSQNSARFWVDPNQKGVSINLNRISGPQLMGNAQFTYDNVRVSEDRLCGTLDGAGDFVKGVLATKYMSYMATLGQLQRLYEETREYAKQRVAGGKPIIQHNQLRMQLGKFAMELEMARALAYRAAYECHQRDLKREPLNASWSMSAVAALKTVCYTFGEVAAEVFGGMVGSRDMPIEGFARWALAILPTGMPRGLEWITVCDDYDTRYMYMYRD